MTKKFYNQPEIQVAQFESTVIMQSSGSDAQDTLSIEPGKSTNKQL